MSSEETFDPSEDRNLLFGQAALHLGLLSTDQLRSAMMDLVDVAGDRSLSQILVEQGALTLEQVLQVLDEIGGEGEVPEIPRADEELAATQIGGPAQESEPVAASVPPARDVSLSDSGSVIADRLLSSEYRTLSQTDQRYTGVNLIGQGGMGKILLVKDQDLRRDVVMKQMLSGAQANALKVHRFIEEAQITSQLEHPNIVPVHEIGVTRTGQIYFTMKRVSGEDLGEVVKQLRADNPKYTRRYTLAHRLGLMLSMCNAIAFAHSRGVIHRDLKPENVMVGEFGELLVMDWGLAKLLDGSQSSDGPTPSSGSSIRSDRADLEDDISRTMEGQVMGTPKYMAPEQARGHNHLIDERTDIYSLGALLFELLCFRPPFDKGSIFEVMVWVAEGQFVPPGDDPDDPLIPREVVAIVMKAMATEKAKRYRSVGELKEDIQAYLDGFSVSAHRDNALVRALKWTQRNKAAATGILAGLLALMAGGFAVRTFQKAQLTQQYKMMMSSAEEKLQRGDYEGAQTDSTKALGLRPDSQEANRQLHRAILKLAEERRLQQISARIGTLRLRLKQEKREAIALHAPGADRGAWYAAQTRCLNTARELVRIEPKNATHPRMLAELAREMATRLVNDRSFELASLMIDEAEAAGLNAGLIKMDRSQLQDARSKHARKSVHAARQLLAQLQQGVMTERRRRDYLSALLKLSNSQLVAYLIPRVYSHNAWERLVVIEALGRIGDGKTTARLSESRLPKLKARRGGGAAAMRLAQLRGELRGRWLPKLDENKKQRHGRAVRLDAVQTLTLKLLTGDLRAGYQETLLLAWSLGRLGDARAKQALNLKRWAAGFASRFWRQSAAPYRLIAFPRPAADPQLKQCLREALARHGQGQFEQALSGYAACLALEQRNPELYILRGLVYQQQHLLARAIGQYDKALELDARQPQALYLRGAARHENGAEASVALADLDALLKLRNGRHAPAHNKRGEVLLGDDPKAAMAAFRRATALDEFLALPHLNRGKLLASAGRQREAISAYTEALRLDPSRTFARLGRGHMLQEMEEKQAALADFELVIRQAPDEPTVYFYRARLRFARRNYWGAVNDLNQAIRLRPRWIEAHMARARCFAALRRTFQRIADLSAVLDQQPDHVEALKLRVKARIRYGDQDGALLDLTRLIRLEPKRVSTYVDRATILKGKQDYLRALADLAIARELDSNYAMIYLLTGRIILASGRQDAALIEMSKAAKLVKADDPNRGEILTTTAQAFNTRGMARANAQQYPAAIRDLREAVRLNPRLWRAMVFLGQLLAGTGQKAEGLEVMEEGKRRAPRETRAEIDKLIQQVRARK